MKPAATSIRVSTSNPNRVGCSSEALCAAKPKAILDFLPFYRDLEASCRKLTETPQVQTLLSSILNFAEEVHDG
jgi:hypothetical protein